MKKKYITPISREVLLAGEGIMANSIEVDPNESVNNEEEFLTRRQSIWDNWQN